MSLSCGFGLGKEDTEYTSAQFSDAMSAFTGNGITTYGKQFSLTVNGFTATINTGYSLISGRYIENDESRPLSIPLPSNYGDRTDAIVLSVNYEEREISVEVISGVDELAVRQDPSILRQNGKYCCVLYFIHIRRGSTSIDTKDIVDVRGDKKLCGWIYPLSMLTKRILHVYRYATTGVDEDLNRVVNAANQLVVRSDQAISAVQEQIKNLSAGYEIGELMSLRGTPEPANEWLLCDGSAVPEEFGELNIALKGNLPNISRATDRYRTYIYGGTPNTGQKGAAYVHPVC